MEPHETRSRGGIIYACPECGYEMPMAERSADAESDEAVDT